MKLRKKSDIGTQFAEERQKQIDEGVHIAQKIDTLRQTLATLEKQHQDFIAGMQGELNRQVSGLLTQIEELKTEIADLEERRRLLQIPLDEAWAEVRAEKKKASDLIADLQKSQGKAEVLEANRAEKLRVAKEALSRIKIRERELLKVYASAETDREEAQKAKDQALSDKARVEAVLTEKSTQLDKREQQLTFDEGAVAHQKELNARKESELKDKEREIEDRYETLQRTLKRLK